MIKNLYSIAFVFLLASTISLSAMDEYDIQDIGTIQTKESQAIALNNQGQIIGWYNIDGSTNGKHVFFRDNDGSFYELPQKTPDAGLAINWQYLTENGNSYGTFAVNQATTALCMWDKRNGFVKLGIIPGKEISAINNCGQVLIKSVVENENGTSVFHPVIWDNGKTTKLNGLQGNMGISSKETYGLDMNNRGDVVGQSRVTIVHKNNEYRTFTHAGLWKEGNSIDCHYKLPKSTDSYAIAINDFGDVIVAIKSIDASDTKYLLKNDGALIKLSSNGADKVNNKGYTYFHSVVLNEKGEYVLNKNSMNDKLKYDLDSIWISISNITKVNDEGKIIAQGETIYGEKHAILLTPVKSN